MAKIRLKVNFEIKDKYAAEIVKQIHEHDGALISFEGKCFKARLLNPCITVNVNERFEEIIDLEMYQVIL